MEFIASDGQREEADAKLWTDMKEKRIRGRFRATLAGLLELEVLRLKHKGMVETALGKNERSDLSAKSELQGGQHRYWVEDGCFSLRLVRSLSHENVADARRSGSFAGLKRTATNHSSEDLQHFHCLHRRLVSDPEESQSRASSGFCESDIGDICSIAYRNNAVSSLSTSLASLSYLSDAGYYGREDAVRRRPVLLKKENCSKNGTESKDTFSEEVIPAAGFLSVVDLYPDSHWADVADILQPQVVLEPSYRSDLTSFQGTEVYRYPSPLHAVALQSPLYAPQSPAEHRKSNGRCPPRRSTLTSDSMPDSKTLDHPCLFSESRSSTSLPWWHTSGTGKHGHSKNSRCEEIILKRARCQAWSQSIPKCGDGVHLWSKRSVASLHRTCSMGKGRAYSPTSCAQYAQKCLHFQSRYPGAMAVEAANSAVSPHGGSRARLGTYKNRNRRHTAALTNLNIFKESSSTLPACGKFLYHCCSLRPSGETNTYHGNPPEVSKEKI